MGWRTGAELWKLRKAAATRGLERKGYRGNGDATATAKTAGMLPHLFYAHKYFCGGVLLLPLKMLWSWQLPRRIFICVRAHTSTHAHTHTSNVVVSDIVVDVANVANVVASYVFFVAAIVVAVDIFDAATIA